MPSATYIPIFGNLPLCPLLAAGSSTGVITVERTVERKACDGRALLHGMRADVTSGVARREEQGLRDLPASPPPLPQPPSRTPSAARLRRLPGTDGCSKCATEPPHRLRSHCRTGLRERRDGGLDLLALRPPQADRTPLLPPGPRSSPPTLIHPRPLDRGPRGKLAEDSASQQLVQP
ncbi:Hypothetical predicted protein [Pelobates cultripes]|uniref:Uncharacterized protein n=1 Tax=Pelobates cultripes TaxID=61616 RepID=A0AAD1S041_PELCU|nr:Hypothetical predicted protein [Pelobates cultripes]